jgi:hypothetical protein
MYLFDPDPTPAKGAGFEGAKVGQKTEIKVIPE